MFSLPMRISHMLANITPVCPCRGYIEAGHQLRTVAGSVGNTPAWWVACPDCGNALGQAMAYPVCTSAAVLQRRGYIDSQNANA